MSPRDHDIEADAGSSHTALRGRYGWTVSETVSRVRLLDMLHRGKRIESAACPVSTGGGTRRVRSVRGEGPGRVVPARGTVGLCVRIIKSKIFREPLRFELSMSSTRHSTAYDRFAFHVLGRK